MPLLQPKMHLQICLLFLFLYSIFNLTYATHSKKILYLTDIHLNHLYDSSPESRMNYCTNPKNIFQYILSPNDYGNYGCDSNLNLLDSLLDQIKIENKENFELIIIGGDSLMHAGIGLDEALKKIGSNPLDETKKMFEIVRNKIKDKLNNCNILFVPGNNDFYEHYDTPNKDSLEIQTNTIKKIFMEEFYLKNKNKFNENFQTTIADGFYYTYDFNDKLKFIVINTIFFSVKNSKINEADEHNLGIKHIQWIESQINIAQKENKKVILIGHIPPFLYYVFHHTEHLIKNSFKRLIKELLYKYKENILYFFASHCHLPRLAVKFNIEKTDKIIKCNNFNFNNFFQSNKAEKVYDNEFLSGKASNNGSNRFLQFIKFSEINNVKNNNNKSNKKLKTNFPTLKDENLEVAFYSSFISFPSLSPIYENNPGYSVLEFDEDKNLLSNVRHNFFNLLQAEKFRQYMLDNKEKINKAEDLSIKKFIQSNEQFEFKEIADKEDQRGYKNLLLKNLWNNKYSYKEDFNFENFNANDFAKFLFSKLYDKSYLKKYYTFMLGYNQLDYESAEKIIKASGLVDDDSDLKKFRSIFYKIEEDDCDMRE